ncbi:sucrose synthase [Geitlerinema sp. P-1104]|uniref:sucrose synthase n=1 Tax=Geitlerinema sp. P-1104 TaxID=2546230 RepID=UPI00147745FE|nr:sucrose synthase [Geitlerinema sp. P-1104]NMG58000.1 sucrose synthase [Geitlerinema sp. P-1104]
MSHLLQSVLNSNNKLDLRQFFGELRLKEQRYLLRNDIDRAFSDYCKQHQKSQEFQHDSPLAHLIYYTQELIVDGESICAIIRPKIAHQEVYRIHEDLSYDAITVQDLLDTRDRFVGHYRPQDGDVFEIDFEPFYDYSPSIRDPKNIGKGVEFLNRYLSSKLFQDPREWQETLFQFLSLHSYNGLKLLINPRIKTWEQLSDRVKQAISFTSQRPEHDPYDSFRFDLQDLGFEPGWGNTAGRVRDTLNILDELIDSPNDQVLETFVSRIPMIFRIVLVSVHGWFGQEGVLGRPDTGGQVVYVLDQARSLEKQLQAELHEAGLDVLGVHPKVIVLSRLIPNAEGTRCNERLEKIWGTDDAWILRVPFREFNPKVTQNWISRFEIWPYLETFTLDAEKELLAEFKGSPDLIVGNYSDGNIVAFLLSRRLKVTQFNVAHALEKSKYLFSNLYWQDLEKQYHFSIQFTADLIAMNAANCIISSTYQEIVGKPDSVGQYESYHCFSMPDFYHVVSGINLFSPKFNVVAPGVNEAVFFPYSRQEERVPGDVERLDKLLFTDEDPNQVYGKLEDPNKRPLFSMARLDRIKNLSGLVDCFGQNPELQEHYNLIFIAGKLREEESDDAEEIAEMRKLYESIERYNLHGKFRWLGVRLPKVDSGEVYRVIADRRGVFVQPALFEAFGLTILEAMISGLPTFGTQFGGPLEIIQDKINGFYINPTNLEEMAQKLVDFATKCQQNPDYWLEISQKGMDRVYTTYTWQIHTSRLLSMAKTYGFWNYSSQENREDMLRYLESLFYLIYKPRAQAMLAEHMAR